MSANGRCETSARAFGAAGHCALIHRAVGSMVICQLSAQSLRYAREATCLFLDPSHGIVCLRLRP